MWTLTDLNYVNSSKWQSKGYNICIFWNNQIRLLKHSQLSARHASGISVCVFQFMTCLAYLL